MRNRILAALLCLLMVMPGAYAQEDAEGYDFVVYHANRNEKRIAITVDDCYNIKNIRQIFALCEEYNIPMTFFPNGMGMREKHRELWNDIVDFGCEIGNHTNTHPDMQTIDNNKRTEEILKNQEILDTVLGYHYPMQLYRPPFGNKSRDVNRILQENGYKHSVLWDVANLKYKAVFKSTENGSILLFHADDEDVACLKKLVPLLVQEGYECCTVSELLGLPPVETSELLWKYDKKTKTLVLRPDDEQPSLQKQNEI